MTDFMLNPAVGVTWVISSDAKVFRIVVLPALSKPSRRSRSSRSGAARSFRRIDKSPIALPLRLAGVSFPVFKQEKSQPDGRVLFLAVQSPPVTRGKQFQRARKQSINRKTMKVFYNGFNLYRQFPKSAPLVEKFAAEIIENLRDVAVNHTFSVLLVANNSLVFSGAKNRRLTLKHEWEISQIASNEDLVLVLLKNGDILKIAQTPDSLLKSHFIKLPKLVDLDEGDHAVLLACGAKLTVALTKNGHVYNVPNKLNFRDPDVVDVKTGREHCLILCKNGDVYTFGRGSRGQLGHGCLEDQAEPKLLEALAGLKISEISAGGWHSCALSKDGDMYLWGWNGNGQIGLSPHENQNDDTVSVMAVPHFIEFDRNVRKIGCGNRHTIALLENGHLFGCGWNKYKQLHDDPQENFYRMTYLHDFSQETVNGINCGPWNTLVLCDDS